MRRRTLAYLATILALATAPAATAQEDWSRFRGPNGSGASAATGLPVSFGPDENVAWALDAPPGRSSPILVGDRLFLTGIDGESLIAVAVDAPSGEVVWRRELTRPRHDDIYRQNDAATPTPATDGDSFFAFFSELGVIAFDLEGNERWRRPLGPFDSFYGIAASLVVVDGLVLVLADQSSGSYLLALDAATGNETWRADRPARIESHTTPVLYPSAAEPRQVIVFGSSWVDAYDLVTGEPSWALPGIGGGPIASPVLAGNRLVVTSPDHASELPAFATWLADLDDDGDGALSRAEFDAIPGWNEHFGFFDRDGDGLISAPEHAYVATEYGAGSWGLQALDLPAVGAADAPRVAWTQQQSVAYISSPVIHEGVVYMARNGGIVSSVDLTTGEVLKRGRTSPSAGENNASLVLADGKIFVASVGGELAMLDARPDWEVLAVNDLGEPIHATPVPAPGRLYVRTASRLYAFEAASR